LGRRGREPVAASLGEKETAFTPFWNVPEQVGRVAECVYDCPNVEIAA
jgi:hypothetical protein